MSLGVFLNANHIRFGEDKRHKNTSEPAKARVRDAIRQLGDSGQKITNTEISRITGDSPTSVSSNSIPNLPTAAFEEGKKAGIDQSNKRTLEDWGNRQGREWGG